MTPINEKFKVIRTNVRDDLDDLDDIETPNIRVYVILKFGQPRRMFNGIRRTIKAAVRNAVK